MFCKSFYSQENTSILLFYEDKLLVHDTMYQISEYWIRAITERNKCKGKHIHIVSSENVLALSNLLY